MRKMRRTTTALCVLAGLTMAGVLQARVHDYVLLRLRSRGQEITYELRGRKTDLPSIKRDLKRMVEYSKQFAVLVEADDHVPIALVLDTARSVSSVGLTNIHFLVAGPSNTTYYVQISDFPVKKRILGDRKVMEAFQPPAR